MSKNKYLFGYESLNELEIKKWSLALELPLHGEELLTLDWSKAGSEVVAIEGDFYRRLLLQLHSRQKMKNLMKVFLLKTGQVIDTKNEFSLESNQYICAQSKYNKYKNLHFGDCVNSESKFNFSWEISKENFKIIVPFSGKYIYEIQFQNLKGNHFNKISATLFRKPKNQKLFSMKLFIGSCMTEQENTQ